MSPWPVNTRSRHFWNWIQLSGFPLLKYGTATSYVGDPGSAGVVLHLNVCTRCFPLASVFGRAKGIGGSLCEVLFMVLGTDNFIFGSCWFVGCFSLFDLTIFVMDSKKYKV